MKVSLRLTEDARRGLDRAAARAGVSLTALLEAFGLLLLEQPDLLLDEAVERARQIDAERRSRR